LTSGGRSVSIVRWRTQASEIWNNGIPTARPFALIVINKRSFVGSHVTLDTAGMHKHVVGRYSYKSTTKFMARLVTLRLFPTNAMPSYDSPSFRLWQSWPCNWNPLAYSYVGFHSVLRIRLHTFATDIWELINCWSCGVNSMLPRASLSSKTEIKIPFSLIILIISGDAEIKCVLHFVNAKLSRNRPWRPIGLWDVKDPTLSRQSAHRWR
jgi:hypothetical protein